jgi:hypothetical protein
LLQNDNQIWNVNCQTSDKFAIYDDTADTERLVILTDGKVGIGTTTPQVELEVSSTDVQLRLSDNNSTSRTNAIAYMEMYDRSTSRLGYVGFGANTNEILYILNEGTTTGANGGDIYFCTQNQPSTPKMMIDVAGNVGIGGITAPDKLLHISSTSDAELHIEGGSDGSGNAYLLLDAGGDSDDSKVIFQKDGNSIGSIDYDHNSTETSAVMKFNLNIAGSADPQMVIQADGKVGIGSTPTYVFDAVAVDTVAENTYVARILNDGQNYNSDGLLISCGKYTLSSAGDARYIGFTDGNGTASGGIRNSSNIDLPEWFEGSDARIKDGIVDTKVNALSVLNQLKIREFTKKGQSKTGIGLVAQEVKGVLPELVSLTPAKGSQWEDDIDDSVKDSNGEKAYYTLGTGILPYYFIKAIQELSEKVTALENK